MANTDKIALGISGCLAQQQIRFDGQSRKFQLYKTMQDKIDWLPMCPEVAIGMTVPRNTIRLVDNSVSQGGADQRDDSAIEAMTTASGELHTQALRDYAVSRLGGLNWLQVQGTTADKGAIFSFTLDGAAHAHDISTILDKKGVAVRAGHHCAGPLMEHLGVTATCRASFGMYNTTGEVDALVDALELAHDLFA